MFDWAWADAYARNGMRYCPKLVSASPYTPATGPKLLVAADAPAQSSRLLLATAQELARQAKASSLHWLFTTAAEDPAARAGRTGKTGRLPISLENRRYADFDTFLATLSSAKRKNIRKERRRVAEAGIVFRQLDGHGADHDDWETFHQLYESTFHRHGGTPTLSLGFFRVDRPQYAGCVLLILAEHASRPVAAAFAWSATIRCTDDTGAAVHILTICTSKPATTRARLLHPSRPGALRAGCPGRAQGGTWLLPTETYSAHWLADTRFHEAIAGHLDHERAGMRDYLAEMQSHSPYRADSTP